MYATKETLAKLGVTRGSLGCLVSRGRVEHCARGFYTEESVDNYLKTRRLRRKEPKVKATMVYVPHALINRVKVVATTRGSNLSVSLEQAIQEWLDRNERS